MASVITERRGKRVRYRIQFRDADGKRKSIRLANANKRTTEAIRSRVESLNHCRIAGDSPSPSLSEWVANLGDELHNKLATAQLVEKRQSSTLAAFIDGYIVSRTDIGKACGYKFAYDGG